MKETYRKNQSESGILERYPEMVLSDGTTKRQFIIVNILLSVVLETTNVLFGNKIASDCSNRLLGFELQFEIICPIEKKKLTRVERMRPSSKLSNPGPKSVSSEG